MNRFKIGVLLLVLFSGALLFPQSAQWEREALKLQNTIRTLGTLISVNPFPGEVPGLETAITNKTGQMMGDMDALNDALEAEMPSLSADERQEALTTTATLMMQVADLRNHLYIRGFSALTLGLVDAYTIVRASYYSLAAQYSLITKLLPIGTRLQDGGGWIPW